MERIKVVKQSLDLDFKVYPRHATSSEHYDRILAVGSKPPFLCDYALIGPRSDSPGLAAALAWTLGLTEDDRATTILDTLNARWPGTREISDEELASERALVAYLTEETED